MHRIVDVVVGGVAVALLSTVVLILAVMVVDHGSVSAWCACLVLAAFTAAVVAKVFPTNAGVFQSGSMS